VVTGEAWHEVAPQLAQLHLAVDADSGRIVAHTLTDQDADDPSQVAPLLDQIDGEIGQVTVDGAYDGRPTYRAVLEHTDTANIVIPPRSTTVESNGDTGPPDQRKTPL
jgi:Transposase DDE domain